MRTEISKDIDLAEARIQYDKYCKKVLSNKVILAWILRRTVKEFAQCSIDEIELCIEDTPEVSTVKVNPGESNLEKITGISTEDAVNEEGVIFYDIRFFAYLPGKNEKIKLIVNVEAQKKFRPGYQLVTRGIFYSARMLSAQLGTEFIIPEYDNIKKVYSIWICMNSPSYIGNAISEYCIEKNDVVPGIPDEREAYDKMSVIMVCLNEKTKTEDDFLKMLNVLLSPEMPKKEKKQTLEDDYQIPMNNELGRELNIMCNLSELVEEKGMEKGMEEGIKQGKIVTLADLVREGILPLADAAKRAGLTESQFKKYL